MKVSDSMFESLVELLERTALKVTDTPQDYMAFLSFAARFYKYDFTDSMMIYAQRPDATACAEYEDWKKVNRYVRRHAKAIKIFDYSSDSPAIRNVFDVSNTGSTDRRKFTVWEFRNEYRENVSKTVLQGYGIEMPILDNIPEILKAIAYHAAAEEFEKIKDRASFIDYAADTIRDLFMESVAWMVLARCDYNPEFHLSTKAFAGVNLLEDSMDICEIGNGVQRAGMTLLRSIERAVKNLDKEKAPLAKQITFSDNNITIQEENEYEREFGEQEHPASASGIREGERNHVQAGGGLLLSAAGASEIGDGSIPDTALWPDAQSVSQGEAGRDVSTPEADRQAASASGGDRRESGTAPGGFDQADGRSRGSERGIESLESDGMGGPDEQYRAESDGDRQGRTDLRLKPIDKSTVEYGLPWFTNDALLNAMLCATPYLAASKEKIITFFEATPDIYDRADFIMGIFNPELTDLLVGPENHPVGYQAFEDGLLVWEGSYDDKRSLHFRDWRSIANRFNALIELKMFLCEDEIPSDEEQINMIKASAEENSSAFVLPQHVIDAILCRGSSLPHGKFRIYQHFQKGLSQKENSAFLKKEYGIGGCTSIISGSGIGEWHDGTGLYLRYFDPNDAKREIHYAWQKVAARINQLVSYDRYLTTAEKEEFAVFLVDPNQVHDTTTNLNEGNRVQTKPGDIIYINIDRYRVLAIGTDTVSLSDEDFPLLTRDIPIAEFERIIREDAANHKYVYDRFDRGSDTVTIDAGDPDAPDWVKETGSVTLSLDGNTVTIEKEGVDPQGYVEVYIEIPDAEDLEEGAHPPESKTDLSAPRTTSPLPEEQRINYHITNDALGVGGAKTKYSFNISAIRLLQEIEGQRRMATPDEQEILSRYVGWGGLPQAFDEANNQWAKEYAELKNLLNEREYEMARASALNAHYTSPVVIRAIYSAIVNMGFQRGNILEPACGIGNFFGLLPESMQDSKLYGVELDSVTGRIARQLYQKANIQVKGFEDTTFSDSSFDLAIGNIPFGAYTVPDKRYAKNKFLIHDYFFAKGLDKVRPGGLMVFVTSKGTLDKQNSAVRRYIAERAELIGAIRLPNTAFKSNAGTDVTTDIIFLKKRERSIFIDEPWIQLGKTEEGVPVNSYFVDHPEMMLGKMVYCKRMYGNEEDTACVPFVDADLSMQLQEAVKNIRADYSELEFDELEEDREFIPADPDVRPFSYAIHDGAAYYRETSHMYRVELPMATLERVMGMVAIRDCTRALIELQTEGYGDNAIIAHQKQLNTLYDTYTKKYGLLNSSGNRSAFKADSSYALLCSLEEVNPDGTLKAKAAMFTKRTIRKRVEITHVETAAEALAVSLAEKGRVDLAFMEKLTDLTGEQIERDLQGVIYHDFGDIDPDDIPAEAFDISTFPIVTADEYLSGDVRKKLKLAMELAAVVPSAEAAKLKVNIEALEAVQPEDLEPADIDVRLGATWVSCADIEDFVMELLNADEMYRRDVTVRYNAYTGSWHVNGKSLLNRQCVKARNAYGTHRIGAMDIIEDTLNLRDVRIFDTFREDGKETRVLNPKETAIAQQKQQEIKEAFVDWVWKDLDRRERLLRLYNDKFNCIRPREFDGSHLTFPGMNPEIILDKHQKDCVARILYGGNTLVAHCVGAGKTFTMVAAALESKRLGLANKNMLLAINNTVSDLAADALRLYPSANILVASEDDLTPHNRKKFCSRIATGDYDLIIIAHSQFERIPLSPERMQMTIEREISDITDAIREAKGDKISVKQLERSKKSALAKLKLLNSQERKDNVIHFEELGVDRLFVDESDNFKNLSFHTKMRNVAGLPQTDAQKASDLFAKCQYLNELTNYHGIIFATGTPISNSMAELYTIQRYLQLRRLRQLGLQHFDAWASTFGETITAMELAPEGTGFRMKTRFARFYNIPELMSIYKEVADIRTADMLNLAVPEVDYHVVSVPANEFQKQTVLEFARRAEQVRAGAVKPTEDNMLKITLEGKKLALDQRLIDPSLPDDPQSKVNACVAIVRRIWEETQDQRLTQLIFCDLSTPKDDGSFNIYDDIRQKLLQYGVPADEVAFVHSAKTNLKRKQLFALVRQGKVRNLLGSTAKLGAGTNVQDLLFASHDLDCPFRPRDLEQRAGRIKRQGNRNKNAHIYRYVTEGTFDAYLYQLVENKQKYIAQIQTSKNPVRRMQDIDETALTYAEIKALATGDPRIMEKMKLDTEVSKLKLVKANFLNQRYSLENRINRYLPEEIRALQERMAKFEHDRALVQDWISTHPVYDGNFYGMTIRGKEITQKADAGEAILKALQKEYDYGAIITLGSYLGLEIQIEKLFKNHLYLRGAYRHEVGYGEDGIGMVHRMNNCINNFPDEIKDIQRRLNNCHKQIDEAKSELAHPFRYEAELTEKQLRLAQLNIDLSVDAKIIDDAPDLEDVGADTALSPEMEGVAM